MTPIPRPGGVVAAGQRNWPAAVLAAALMHGGVIGLLWMSSAGVVADAGEDIMTVVLIEEAVPEPVAADAAPAEPAPTDVASPEPINTAPIETEPTPPPPPEPVAEVAPEGISDIQMAPKVLHPILKEKPLPPKRATVPAPEPVPAKAELMETVAPMPTPAQATRAAVPERATVPRTGGSASSSADYLAKLQAWLAARMMYPSPSRRRHEEGTVRLAFWIGRNGQVGGVRIVRGSGFWLLDEEAMAMVARAGPPPPLPDGMADQRTEFVVPVEFKLRR